MQLHELQAGGGGDIAEDLIGPLAKSAELSWEGKVRWVMVFSDAPSHGKDFHDMTPREDNAVSDRWCVSSPDVGAIPPPTPEDVFRALLAKHVDVWLCPLAHGVHDKTLVRLKAAAVSAGCDDKAKSVEQLPVTAALARRLRKRFHFVFVVDSCLRVSMGDAIGSLCWSILRDHMRRTQTSDDMVSVVSYSNTATVVLEYVPVSVAIMKPLWSESMSSTWGQWHNTEAAFNAAGALLKKHALDETVEPAILFFSDGQLTKVRVRTQPEALLRDTEIAARSPQFHAVPVTSMLGVASPTAAETNAREAFLALDAVLEPARRFSPTYKEWPVGEKIKFKHRVVGTSFSDVEQASLVERTKTEVKTMMFDRLVRDHL